MALAPSASKTCTVEGYPPASSMPPNTTTPGESIPKRGNGEHVWYARLGGNDEPLVPPTGTRRQESGWCVCQGVCVRGMQAAPPPPRRRTDEAHGVGLEQLVHRVGVRVVGPDAADDQHLSAGGGDEGNDAVAEAGVEARAGGVHSRPGDGGGAGVDCRGIGIGRSVSKLARAVARARGRRAPLLMAKTAAEALPSCMRPPTM